jgi:hypothetical protein
VRRTGENGTLVLEIMDESSRTRRGMMSKLDTHKSSPVLNFRLECHMQRTNERTWAGSLIEKNLRCFRTSSFSSRGIPSAKNSSSNTQRHQGPAMHDNDTLLYPGPLHPIYAAGIGLARNAVMNSIITGQAYWLRTPVCTSGLTKEPRKPE